MSCGWIYIEINKETAMDLSSALVSVSLGLATYVLYRLVAGRGAAPRGRGRLRAPPALPSLPLLGSLPFMSGASELHTCLAEKAKRYGNVFAFHAGSK